MSSAEPTPPTQGSEAAENEKKTLWERILFSTPVVMTVMATVLAGASSGMMTQAQYHRALAAQYQSKVGDQWNFFQARRIRGSTVNMTTQSLRALTEIGEVDEAGVRAVFASVVGDLERAEQETARLLEKIKEGANGEKSAAEKLLKQLKAQGQRARKLQDDLQRTLDGQEPKTSSKGASEEAKAEGASKEEKTMSVAEQFAYLTGRSLPVPDDEKTIDPATGKERLLPVEAALEKDIQQISPHMVGAIKLVKGRASTKQLKELIRNVPEEKVDDAIEAVLKRERAFDQLSRGPTNLGRRLTEKLGQLLALARSFDRETHAFAGTVQGGADKLTGLSEKAKADVQKVFNSFHVAELDYEARRYEREARYNQGLAEVLEVLVAESAINSDIFRARSNWLFFGMLAAQAGVTIATFSLAVRKRSVLWAVAASAGLSALAIAGYGFIS
jgi:hypothetical protein